MASKPTKLTDRLEFARYAARAAGEITMRYFSQQIAVERKSDDSPVTVADRNAEQHLRELLGEAFPDDGIIGEEYGATEGKTGYRWILDPIDGTKSFITGVPLFSTLVAAQYEGQSVLGVIELPALNERVFAASGLGAFRQVGEGSEERVSVATNARLSEGVYLTSDERPFVERGALEVHRQLQASAWISRTWGDGYGYYLVATGRALAMVDAAMSIWDAAALQPVLVEAGGTFTDWQGMPTVEGMEGIGTNGRVLEEVLRLTRPYAKRSSPD